MFKIIWKIYNSEKNIQFREKKSKKFTFEVI